MGYVPLPRRPGESIAHYRAALLRQYESYYGRRLPRRLPGEADDEHTVRVCAALKRHEQQLTVVLLTLLVLVAFFMFFAWRRVG